MHRRANPNPMALLQAAAARAEQRGGVPPPSTKDAAAVQLQYEQFAESFSKGLEPRDFMECLTRGMQDGLAEFDTNLPRFSVSMEEMLVRSYCTSIPIPFSAFDGIRSSKHEVKLTSSQEENVRKAFYKLVKTYETESAGVTKLLSAISESLPFVSAFFDQRCPELSSGALPSSRSGATFLLLSVITGHTDLCRSCLSAGANPNNMTFLRGGGVGDPVGEMSHGYSPMFMAVLAEQLEIMDLLSEFGGSVHVYDRWGRTPLHAAVAMNSVEVVQWLLAKGAPRYVGDCLNLIPAESGEEDYFPELSMPNVALHGRPRRPPLSYLESRSVKAAEAGKPKKETTPAAAAATASGVSDEGEGKSADDKGAQHRSSSCDEVPELCHCHSGNPRGYCGCVDDMYVRWSVDRLASSWCPGIDFYQLAQKQREEEQQKLDALSRRRKQ